MSRTLLVLLAEFVPLTAFFLTNHFTNFLRATAIYLALTLLVFSLVKHYTHRAPKLALIFGTFITIAGSLTLIFQEPQILIFTDTIYYTFGALLMLYTLLATKTTLLEFIFNHTFNFSQSGWRLLTWCWFGTFVLAAFSNELVRLTMTPEWWVDFQFVRALLLGLSIPLQLWLCRHHRDLQTTNRLGIIIAKQ